MTGNLYSLQVRGTPVSLMMLLGVWNTLCIFLVCLQPLHQSATNWVIYKQWKFLWFTVLGARKSKNMVLGSDETHPMVESRRARQCKERGWEGRHVELLFVTNLLLRKLPPFIHEGSPPSL
jgi:hypothetical protein